MSVTRTRGPTITVGRRVFRVLFPDLLRPLNYGERSNLEESIRKNGVQVAVMVDENNGVIDGVNRLKIASAIGLTKVPTDVHRGLSSAKKRDLAESLNADRRHLTMEEQQEIRAERVQRVAEKRREGKSLRAIAEEEGVSQEQVRLDAEQATVKGLTVESLDGKVTGLDGRQRRAQREPPPPPEYPHSERFHRWLSMVEGETAILLNDGGIGKLLAEPDKWDWGDVTAFLLPMLEGLQRILASYEKELRKHADKHEKHL